MTPPVTDSNTTALPASSAITPAVVILENSALPISDQKSSAAVPVSTRPKPRKKAKVPALSDNHTPATTLPEAKRPNILPVETALPVESLIQSTTSPAIEAVGGKSLKSLKTYGSKDKNVGAKRISESAGVVDLISAQPLSTREVPTSEGKTVQSKSRAIIDSDSELSDTPVNPKTKRKNLLDTVQKADDQTIKSDGRPPQAPKRKGKKRAIITSDDEDDYPQETTPDSKRKKSEEDQIRSNRSSPNKKAEAVRGSSIDPLDMNVGVGFSGNAGKMEVSVDLSPSNHVDFGLTDGGGANMNDKSAASNNLKSPNKVHFADTTTVAEEEIAVAKPKSKQAKSKATRQEDAYDDEPEMYAAPADDEDDEDDFVPSGGKKSKAKAKPSKAKKVAAPKTKAKGKKVSQAKSKNAESVEIVNELTALPKSATIESALEHSAAVVDDSTTLGLSTEEVAEAVAATVEVSPTKPSADKNGKGKKAAASSRKKGKSSKAQPDDEELQSDAQADQSDRETAGAGGRSKLVASAAIENQSEKQQIMSAELERPPSSEKIVAIPSVDDSQSEKQQGKIDKEVLTELVSFEVKVFLVYISDCIALF